MWFNSGFKGLKEMEFILESLFSVYFNKVLLTVYENSFTESYRIQFHQFRNVAMDLFSIKIFNLNRFEFSKKWANVTENIYSTEFYNITWKLFWCVKYATERKGTYSCLDKRLVLVECWIENLHLMQAIYSMLREIPMPCCSILQWVSGKFIHPEVMYRRK